MLDQIARHGNIDLEIRVKGDLHIDEHHTIEDTALTLGEAILKALGGKKRIERYSFVLPMDDSLAQVALDFGGRPWLMWDVNFAQARVGEVPVEMFFHFFKSFSDTAKCNLNIKAEGQNDHHKIEAIFKAFAKAIKQAVNQTDNYNIPTTKGLL
jgi:imidazoleglycerol-phosphate dehydratase/histidinol-phosphatase